MLGRHLGRCRKSPFRIRGVRNVFDEASPSVSTPQDPLELDPSYLQLLDDIDMSLKRADSGSSHPHAEREQARERGEAHGGRSFGGPLPFVATKRSAAATIGRSRVGQMRLPFELEHSMQKLLDQSIHDVRSDAKRLQSRPPNKPTGSLQWSIDTPKFKRTVQEQVLGSRHGLAYASVSLSSQIVTINAILHELSLRLPSGWDVRNVIDFGSDTGAGFWSTLSYFAAAPEGWEGQDLSPVHTNLARYIALDNRTGLVSVARSLERQIDHGKCEVTRSSFWPELESSLQQTLRSEGKQTIALCAFTLSQLTTPAAKKRMVKEMWDTDAEFIVIVDQGTTEGFHAVADARETLLKLGRQTAQGCHVVAPCPHDKACPLRQTADVCFFHQKYIIPKYELYTKKAKFNAGSATYSYVIIRRGERPFKPAPIHATHASSSEASSPLSQELSIKDSAKLVESTQASPPKEHVDGDYGEPVTLTTRGFNDGSEANEHEASATEEEDELSIPEAERERLKRDAYYWRRILYSPIKSSGHITMDTCTAKGEITRMVIPKSQGKQAYYDARKSSWGDLFPHDPKNGEIVRQRGIKKLGAMPYTPSKEDEKEAFEMDMWLKEMMNTPGARVTGKGSFTGLGEKPGGPIQPGTLRQMKAVEAKFLKENRPKWSKSERREAHRERKKWKRDEEKMT